MTTAVTGPCYRKAPPKRQTSGREHLHISSRSRGALSFLCIVVLAGESERVREKRNWSSTRLDIASQALTVHVNYSMENEE